jgi:hypothetical protein
MIILQQCKLFLLVYLLSIYTNGVEQESRAMQNVITNERQFP